MRSIGTVCNEYSLIPLDRDARTIAKARRLFNPASHKLRVSKGPPKRDSKTAHPCREPGQNVEAMHIQFMSTILTLCFFRSTLFLAYTRTSRTIVLLTLWISEKNSPFMIKMNRVSVASRQDLHMTLFSGPVATDSGTVDMQQVGEFLTGWNSWKIVHFSPWTINTVIQVGSWISSS